LLSDGVVMVGGLIYLPSMRMSRVDMLGGLVVAPGVDKNLITLELTIVIVN